MARVIVKPNTVGYLFQKQVYSRTFGPGVYELRGIGAKSSFYTHTTTESFLDVRNQEVLTKDTISLRLSYLLKFRIQDGLELLKYLDLSNVDTDIQPELEQRLHLDSQIQVRQLIAGIFAQDLNNQRDTLLAAVQQSMDQQYASIGVRISAVEAKDISFPKAIQEVFSKQLEAQIRAKTDLENARTHIATARALKNASEIAQSDPNIKFFQWIEALTKIASKGNHTFVVGEFPETKPKQ